MDKYKNIPAELRQLPQWVVRKGKKPIDPRSGSMAKAGQPATWGTFGQAASAPGYDGIGFEFAESGGIVGVDLDTVRDPKTGYIAPEAVDIINTLESYTEISPSGYGFHIFLRADLKLPWSKAPLPDNGIERYETDPKTGKRRRKAPELEVYNEKRYFTVTGDRYGERAGLEERTAELKAVMACYGKKKAAPAPPPPLPIDSQDWLKRGLEKDKKLRALWDGERPTGDESRDDLSLMNKLAYWCNRDTGAMTAAFLSSPYVSFKDEEHQKKAQRKDYLQRTAEQAVRDCQKTAIEDHEKFREERTRDDFGAPSPADVFGRSEPQRGQAAELSVISARELQDKDLPPLRFLVHDVLPPGLTILAAPPKFGKSWWVLDLCLSLADGAPFLGHQTEKCGCLYLALEDSERRLQDRMNKILHGERAPEDFDYATKSPDLGNGLIKLLHDYIAQHPKTRLVVIDTFQKVRPPNAGKDTAYSVDYNDAGALKEFADKHSLCVLIVHHLRKMKDDTDVFNQISGTNGISGAADTSIVLSRKKRTDEQTTLSITGRDVESSDTVMRFDKEEYRWKMLGSLDWLEEQRARLAYQESPIVKTVKELLKQSPQEGWKGTLQQLLEAGKTLAGTYLAETPRKLSSLLSALDKPMFEYDEIVHDKGKNGSGGSSHRFFYSHNYTPEYTTSSTVEQLPLNHTVDTVDDGWEEVEPL